MEDTFRFQVGIGKGLVEATMWLEIPRELHDRVAAFIGNDKMARLEFGYHFQDIIDRNFRELDTIIHEAIESWIHEHDLGDTAEYWMHFYSLQSSWFEEELDATGRVSDIL